MSRTASSVPASGRRHWALLTTISVVLLSLGLFLPATAAGGGQWAPTVRPWSPGWEVTDIAAFRPTGLVAVGAGGHIAVSRNGGATWTVIVPSGHSATVFGAVAFNNAGHGVVASGGLLLVTGDDGSTWYTPTFAGAGPGALIRDVGMAGAVAVAVGDGGVIVSSTDSGATWSRLVSPTSDDLVAVAVAGDGTAVAGASTGALLTGKGATWSLAGNAGAAVTAAAAVPTPAWGDGRPDLLVGTAEQALGSDDALTFTSLSGTPVIYSVPWHDLAWVGRPGGSFLLSGAGDAGFFSTLSADRLPTQTGLAGSTGAAAPGTQSIAYVLGPDGRIARTLSSSRVPAVTRLSAQRITIGKRVSFTAIVSIAAPGRVRLERRIPGQAWQTAKAMTWTTGDWQKSLTLYLRPILNQEFRVRFTYGGATTTLAPVRRLVVRPRLTPERLRYTRRVGDVYRFAGSVSPRLPGERIDLYTDRGGRWRPVSGQESVALRDGRQWTSRAFGTPKAETYHLRSHVSATARHGEAWSPVVTVVIR